LSEATALPALDQASPRRPHGKSAGGDLMNLQDLQLQARLFRSLMQPPATASPDAELAELIDRHVRRLLARTESRGEAEVRIELSDEVFPGTAFRLRRTADGWHLTATADNRQSLDKLNEFAPALSERFERAALGRLQVSVESP
jgi:hypothetical protein